MIQFFALFAWLAVVASGVLIYFVVSLFASDRLASFAGLVLAAGIFAPKAYRDPSFMNLASISVGLLVLWWQLFLRKKHHSGVQLPIAKRDQ